MRAVRPGARLERGRARRTARFPAPSRAACLCRSVARRRCGSANRRRPPRPILTSPSPLSTRRGTKYARHTLPQDMAMTNASVREAARKLFPGGVNSPVHFPLGGRRTGADRARRGPYVYDIEGARYIDTWRHSGRSSWVTPTRRLWPLSKVPRKARPPSGRSRRAKSTRAAGDRRDGPRARALRESGPRRRDRDPAARAAAAAMGGEVRWLYHGHSDGLLVKAGTASPRSASAIRRACQRHRRADGGPPVQRPGRAVGVVQRSGDTAASSSNRWPRTWGSYRPRRRSSTPCRTPSPPARCSSPRGDHRLPHALRLISFASRGGLVCLGRSSAAACPSAHSGRCWASRASRPRGRSTRRAR